MEVVSLPEELRQQAKISRRSPNYNPSGAMLRAADEIERLRNQNVGGDVGHPRPIATAPKDAPEILIYGVMKDRSEPSWHIGKWFPCGSYGDGWWVSACVSVKATLWAPLPAVSKCGLERGTNDAYLEIHQPAQ